MMKVLVTGAAGFVAGHFMDLLRQDEPEAEVFGLARPHGAPAEVPGRVTVIEADLLDAAGVAAAVELAVRGQQDFAGLRRAAIRPRLRNARAAHAHVPPHRPRPRRDVRGELVRAPDRGDRAGPP